jgi:hypothetical protein
VRLWAINNFAAIKCGEVKVNARYSNRLCHKLLDCLNSFSSNRIVIGLCI